MKRALTSFNDIQLAALGNHVLSEENRDRKLSKKCCAFEPALTTRIIDADGVIAHWAELQEAVDQEVSKRDLEGADSALA